MELKPGFLEEVNGKFFEAPIYNENLHRARAKEFDRQFCE